MLTTHTTSPAAANAPQRITPAQRRRQTVRHMAAVHHVSTNGRRDLRAAIEQLDREFNGDGIRTELAYAGLL